MDPRMDPRVSPTVNRMPDRVVMTAEEPVRRAIICWIPGDFVFINS